MAEVLAHSTLRGYINFGFLLVGKLLLLQLLNSLFDFALLFDHICVCSTAGRVVSLLLDVSQGLFGKLMVQSSTASFWRLWAVIVNK